MRWGDRARCEGAALVAEEFAFEQAGWGEGWRAQFNFDERVGVCEEAEVVDGAGNEVPWPGGRFRRGMRTVGNRWGPTVFRVP